MYIYIERERDKEHTHTHTHHKPLYPSISLIFLFFFCVERDGERWGEMERDGEVERRVVCVCVCSLSLSIHISDCASLHSYTDTSISSSLSLCISVHTLLSLHLSLCLSLPLYLSICPSVCLSLDIHTHTCVYIRERDTERTMERERERETKRESQEPSNECSTHTLRRAWFQALNTAAIRMQLPPCQTPVSIRSPGTSSAITTSTKACRSVNPCAPTMLRATTYMYVRFRV